jgi:hypothetical protein
VSSEDEKNKALARRFLEAAGEAEQRFEALYVLAMD